MLGLKHLETQHGFPSHSINALLRHQETAVQDDCTLAWASDHGYSGEIFTRLVDGRLPYGWRDEAVIKVVHFEIIPTPQHRSHPARHQAQAAQGGRRQWNLR